MVHGAALEEEDLVALGHTQQLPEFFLGFVKIFRKILERWLISITDMPEPP